MNDYTPAEQAYIACLAEHDYETAAIWEAVVDREDRAVKNKRIGMLSSALWYAERGLHVFRLTPLMKIPVKDSHGFEDATTDARLIRKWWNATPDANVGIATGHLVDGIDVDGATGHRSRLDQIERFNALSVLGTVTTPRPGGMHIYIPATGSGNRTKFMDGIDFRGLGGYLVAPPSRLREIRVAGEIEQHAGTYRWTRPLHLG